MTDDASPAGEARRLPGLTACRLCAGETLGAADAVDGGQLARLRGLEDRGITRLTLVDCLDRCERGDVVVVRPSRTTRGPSARPVWFERLAGDDLTRCLADWLGDGGPGRREVPAALAPLQIPRSPRDAD